VRNVWCVLVWAWLLAFYGAFKSYGFRNHLRPIVSPDTCFLVSPGTRLRYGPRLSGRAFSGLLAGRGPCSPLRCVSRRLSGVMFSDTSGAVAAGSLAELRRRCTWLGGSAACRRASSEGLPPTCSPGGWVHGAVIWDKLLHSLKDANAFWQEKGFGASAGIRVCVARALRVWTASWVPLSPAAPCLAHARR